MSLTIAAHLARAATARGGSDDVNEMALVTSSPDNTNQRRAVKKREAAGPRAEGVNARWPGARRSLSHRSSRAGSVANISWVREYWVREKFTGRRRDEARAWPALSSVRMGLEQKGVVAVGEGEKMERKRRRGKRIKP